MRIVALLAAAATLGASAMAHATVVIQPPTPAPPAPPEPQQDACEIWAGAAKENDGPALVQLRLCPDGEGGLVGQLLYRSTFGGYSVRAVEGRFQGDQLALHETRFVDYAPAPGWTHCLMDAYDLRRSTPDLLTGSGASQACGDVDTRYVLHRQPRLPPPWTTTPGTSATPVGSSARPAGAAATPPAGASAPRAGAGPSEAAPTAPRPANAPPRARPADRTAG